MTRRKIWRAGAGVTVAAPFAAACAWHGSTSGPIVAIAIMLTVIGYRFSKASHEDMRKRDLDAADLKHKANPVDMPPDGKAALGAHQSWNDPVLPSIRLADRDAAWRHAVLLYGTIAVFGIFISRASTHAPATWIATFMTVIGMTIQAHYGSDVVAAKRNAKGGAEGLWVRSGPGTEPETTDDTIWYELIPDANVRKALGVMRTRNAFISLVIISITLGAYYGKQG